MSFYNQIKQQSKHLKPKQDGTRLKVTKVGVPGVIMVTKVTMVNVNMDGLIEICIFVKRKGEILNEHNRTKTELSSVDR